MKFKPPRQPACAKPKRFSLFWGADASSRVSTGALAGRCRASAFTLAEVLAALAFMAIVIPVAVEGLRVANLAGQVSQRKGAAMRVAERVLNEMVVTGQSRNSAQNGTIQEGFQQYRWFLRTEPWPEDTMRLLTVQVLFPVQGRDYDVQLSTLMDSSTQ
jgi:general secretion pathway protein I